VGAPLFALLAKGGNHESMRNGVVHQDKVASAVPLPTLAKYARVGTLGWDGANRNQSQRLGHPPL